MHEIALLAARAEFYERAWATRDYLRYVRQHGIDVERASAMAGGTAVTSIVDHGAGRFEWGNDAEGVPGFVCEAIDGDGETTLDLVAWPVNQPRKVLTMFGQASILGLWEAVNPASFYLGKALVMHRTPLEWLSAGCHGAAIVTPALAGWLFHAIPGPIAARDKAHARELLAIAKSIVDESQIVVATTSSNQSAA